MGDSIAIVGSSGRLLTTNLGERIDQYEEVVRFNRAPTNGYEAKVGSKTTLRVVNRPTFASAPLKRWDDDIEFVKKIRDTRILVGSHSQKLINENNTKGYVHESNSIFVFNYPVLLARIKGEWGLPSPTLGFQFFSILVLNNVTPHLYGFDFEDNRPRDHYWHDRPPGSWSHNLKAEMAVLRQLITQNKILLMEENNEKT